ncbi:hypothetical protein HDV05_000212 [Chytridiales sp. JEL 0842]|nr:hypothetical protein HDV05_000212 [Chytridiales sp. JEL 0842]
MTPEEAYAKLPLLKQQLPPQDFEIVKEQIMKPYRDRNRAVAASLIAFMGLMFGYSMYKTKTPDFDNVKYPAPTKSN